MKRFITVSLALILSASVVQADIVGQVKTVDAGGVLLDLGDKLPWSSKVTVNLRKGHTSQHKPGSLVRMKVEAGKVISIRPTSVQPDAIKLTPLSSIKPYRGGYAFESGHTFWGYIPESVGISPAGVHTVLALSGKFDALRFAFLAMESGAAVSTRLFYRIDGGEIVTLTTSTTSLTQVAIDLAGAKSLELWTEDRTSLLGNDPDFVIDAQLLQIPATVPVLSSPSPKELVRLDEELRWRPVVDAIGYRVELECVRLYNTEDALKQRFFSIQMSFETRVVKLSDLNLPLGEYRWRVHSLDDVGVMGHMNDWRSFVLGK